MHFVDFNSNSICFVFIKSIPINKFVNLDSPVDTNSTCVVIVKEVVFVVYLQVQCNV